MTAKSPLASGASKLVISPDASQEALRKAAVLTGAVGAVFSVLFLLSLWLLQSTPRPNEPDQSYIDFYQSDDRRKIVVVGLYVLPFSAVAFIWFTAALRQWASRSSRRGSQLLGTVQLLSGIGFITLTLASAAASILPAAIVELTDAGFDPDMARAFPLYGNALLLVFGIRMAAMFVMTTTNQARSAGVIPRWFAVLSIAIAAVLFLSYSLSIWLVVAFPLWILALGVMIILHAYRADASAILTQSQDDTGSEDAAPQANIEAV